ncbi:MAG: NAD(P)-binding protein [Pseudomonadota bacterium]|nr:NAD(P)-binding protein [Pseudomonadota bacterium]
MHDRITRRDFLDGIACAIALSGAPGLGRAEDAAVAYPPARTGYGGSGPKDFAIAHGVRDGRRYEFGSQPASERYDVVVIGAGIGGLAAVHYLKKSRPKARILIIDNHDDFGGHARRNEFNVDGRFLLGYGGSESMEGPRRRWTSVARACVADLGVDIARFETAFHRHLYHDLGLSSGLFFPREVYAVDRLVTGDPIRSLPTDVPTEFHNGRTATAFLADCPVDEAQRARLVTLYTDTRDVLAGHSLADKRRILSTMSYRNYLQRYFGLDERSQAMFAGRTLDLFAAKTDAVPALDAWTCEFPGFQGLGLPLLKGGVLEGDPYIYHFPDGNASLARLFVRALIPGVAPGRSMDDILTAHFDYAKLDRPENAVRLRLSSTAVALANRPGGVDVLYARGENLTHVTADHVIYAGYSAMLPYICADLGGAQRKAVADQVKAPLVYVNVAIRSWRSWVERGIHYVNNPAGFYSHLKLDYPVSLGDYRFPTRPDEPMIVHLIHVPWPDGPISDLRSAWRAGRAQLYGRSFAEFEAHARDELTRILGPGGFDAGRDIAAITVNRWGHGYAYDMDPLYDPPDFEREQNRSAAPVGRIHFAGSDAAWMAYAHAAIDSAHRAAREITG